MGIGRHVVGRSFMTLEGHGASSFGMYVLLLPFYFVTVFISFFPWSIKLPWLIRKLWRKREAGIVHLRQGYGGQAAPATAEFRSIFICSRASRSFSSSLLWSARNYRTTRCRPFRCLHFCSRGIGLKERRSPAAVDDESRRSLFTTIAIATACVWIAIALVVPPMVARFFPAYQLFQVSRASLQPNMQFAAVEFQEPSLVWYFRSRVQGFLTPLNKRRAAEFMSAPDPRFIVLPTPVAGELFANPPASWRFFTVNGFNIAKGKRVDLTLVLKPE